MGVLFRLEGHEGEISTCRFSFDETLIVSGSIDGTVRIWDVGENSTGECLIVLQEDSEVLDVALDSRGRTLVSGCSSGIGRVYDVRTGDCLWTLHGHSDEISRV